MAKPKKRWPLIWLRRWDKKQQKEYHEEQYHNERSNDQRREECDQRIYPIIEEEE